MGKIVQQPRGTTSEEDGIIGLEGQLRVDTTAHNIRVHDGVTAGGHVIPNESRVKQLIATGGEDATGSVLAVESEAALAAAIPSSNLVAVITSNEEQSFWIWKAGAVESDVDLASSVDGFWRRIDSQVNTYIMMWRAGLFTMQVDGSAPDSNEDTTVWLDDGVVKLYNGSAYVAATSALFARLLASIGGYYTGTVSTPDRLASTLVAISDLDGVSELDDVTETGWYLLESTDTDTPTDVNSPILCLFGTDANVQIVFAVDDSGDRWTRTDSGDGWGTWVYTPGIFPDRLQGLPEEITDLDSAVDSGFYALDEAASNLSEATDAAVLALRANTNTGVQIEAHPESEETYLRYKTGIGTFSDPYAILTDKDEHLLAMRYALGIVPGRYMWFASTDAIPSYAMHCDGSAISRTTYATLFGLIGTSFGSGDGSTTFNLPDSGGKVLRAWVDGQTIDSGRSLNTVQTQAVPSHTHTITVVSNGAHTHTVTDKGTSTFGPLSAGSGSGYAAGSGSTTRTTSSSGSHTHTASASTEGSGSDNRMDNISAVLAIVVA